MAIECTVQQDPTSRGHYWTAGVDGFDGQGHTLDAAVFDLVDVLQREVNSLQAEVLRLRENKP